MRNTRILLSYTVNNQSKRIKRAYSFRLVSESLTETFFCSSSSSHSKYTIRREEQANLLFSSIARNREQLL